MKMVSRITAIGLAGVAICYLGLSGYVWYHDNKRSKQADVQASAVSENNKVLGFLREKGCDYCHTPSAELPAYYYIPGAKQLMDYDIKLGYKSFNLEAVRAALLADKPVSQSDLNKIEWVMQYETMPPTRYTALHWAGKVSDEERAEILAWIAKQRAYGNPHIGNEFDQFIARWRSFQIMDNGRFCAAVADHLQRITRRAAGRVVINGNVAHISISLQSERET